MFKNTKSVIAISRNDIVAGNVAIGSKKITNTIQGKWNEHNLSEALKAIKNKLKSSTFRIVFADDLSYLLEFVIPSKLSGDQEREFIFDKIKENVPDKLDDSEWDFKSAGKATHKADGTKKVIVFAPVRKFLHLLEEAAKEADVVIEAIEPKALAVTRHSNPLIGIALKKDIKGKDEDVLNIVLTDHDDEATTSDDKPSRKGPSITTVVLSIMLVVTLGGAIYGFKTGLVSFSSSNQKKSSVVVGEANIYNYSINLVNGGSDIDNFDSVHKLLQDNGFTDITVADSTESSFKTTTVKAKPNVPTATLDEIRNSLRNVKAVFPSSYLESDYQFDIEIIVGTSES